MKWDRAVSNYKKRCIVVSHTHFISDDFLSLQTPFAIALMAMADEALMKLEERRMQVDGVRSTAKNCQEP